MQSTHVVTSKTLCVFHITGSIHQCNTTKAYYIRELKQDLLGGRALTKAVFRVILNKDPDISGVYPVNKDSTIVQETVSHSLVITQTVSCYFC
jgi:hypothetical protein